MLLFWYHINNGNFDNLLKDALKIQSSRDARLLGGGSHAGFVYIFKHSSDNIRLVKLK